MTEVDSYSNRLVSIIIPCYNCEEFIEQSISSALEQSWPQIEIIVVDDGSTDGSREVIRRFANRIKVIEQENRGGCHARNTGAERASGSYLLFLDADDLLGSEVVNVLVPFAEMENCIAGSPWKRLVKENSDWEIAPSGLPDAPPDGDFLGAWLSGWYIPPSGLLWSRSTYERFGGWDETLSANQDGDLVMRALQGGCKLKLAKGCEVYYRHHGASRTSVSSSIGSLAAFRSRVKVLERVTAKIEEVGQLDRYHEIIGQAYHKLARNNFKTNLELARACALRGKELAGGKSVVGTWSHRALCRLLGLERKEALVGMMSSVGIRKSDRKKSEELRALGKKRRIAFVLFSDPMIYPPTMNAARILARQGFEVEIFGLHYETGDSIAPSEGVRIHYLGTLRKGLRLRIDFLRFCLQVSWRAFRAKYEWIFSYNMMGVMPGVMGARFSGARWIYHNHDITPVSKGYGFYPFLRWFEKYSSQSADIVSFPQRERARLFTDMAKLNTSPVIVGNGPCLDWVEGEDLDQETLEFRSRCGQVVIYQGGLNWMRGLRRVIESMPDWARPAGLLLVGGAELQPSFPEEAMLLARELGVESRLMIKSTVPYGELPQFTKACDIGLGVMATAEDDDCLNIQHLAGASNKLVEYMACGLPVVVPDSEDYREFIQRSGVGIVVDNRSANKIAEGISQLLDDDRLRERMSARGKDLFRNTLCYEAQFQPILDVILEGQAN